MARKPVVLVTGASGEMGHGLISRLAELGTFDILALDIRPLDPELSRRCTAMRVGDILDRHLLDRLRSEFEISIVFHLAAPPLHPGRVHPRGGLRGQRAGHPRIHVPRDDAIGDEARERVVAVVLDAADAPQECWRHLRRQRPGT